MSQQIFESKLPNGGLELSAIVYGRRVAVKYIGHSKTSAYRNFRRHLKSLKD